MNVRTTCLCLITLAERPRSRNCKTCSRTATASMTSGLPRRLSLHTALSLESLSHLYVNPLRCNDIIFSKYPLSDAREYLDWYKKMLEAIPK